MFTFYKLKKINEINVNKFNFVLELLKHLPAYFIF